MSFKNISVEDSGGATSRSVPQTCDCPCHLNGNAHPCGAMCWHPGEDQYGLPLNYSYASVAQLLKAAIIRGISAQSIESALWDSLFLSASEAATGVYTPVAANDAIKELRKWLGDLLVNGE